LRLERSAALDPDTKPGWSCSVVSRWPVPITRRLPLEGFADAFDRRPDDAKVVLPLQGVAR